MTFDKCRECAAKHLRAALAYASERNTSPDAPKVWFIDHHGTVQMLVSRAWVLLNESIEFYPEHYDLAVGVLVQAEEAAAIMGEQGLFIRRVVRNARLAGSADAAMRNLVGLACLEPWVGHVGEAMREWPELRVGQWMNAADFINDFDGLVKTVVPPAPAEGKEGEEAMACCKKAACKGGKCAKPAAKKAACKGGKSKKCCK